MYKELWRWLLLIRRRTRGAGLVVLKCFIPLSHLRWPARRNTYSWVLDMIIQMTRLRFKGKSLHLKLLFVCYFIFCIHFLYVYIYTYIYIYIVGQIYCVKPPSPFGNVFIKNLSRRALSLLTSPVLEPPTTYLPSTTLQNITKTHSTNINTSGFLLWLSARRFSFFAS